MVALTYTSGGETGFGAALLYYSSVAATIPPTPRSSRNIRRLVGIKHALPPVTRISLRYVSPSPKANQYPEDSLI
jgi:hypothetical protein